MPVLPALKRAFALTQRGLAGYYLALGDLALYTPRRFFGVKFYNEVNFEMRNKWILGVIVCLGLPLLGQTLGDLSGRVNDPSGAGVPNAVVSLTNTSTNAVRNTESSTDGLYSFPSVPPGVYNLKVEHPGFRTASSTSWVATRSVKMRSANSRAGSAPPCVRMRA